MPDIFRKEIVSAAAKTLSTSLVVFLSLLCAFALASGFNVVPFLLIGCLIAIIVIYYCLAYPLYGFYIVTVVAFFVAYPSRLLKVQLPISTGIEVLIIILMVGTFRKRLTSGGAVFFSTPASIALLLYFLLILVELFNPNMYSFAGWFFFTRRFIMFALIYVIAYRLFDDIKKIESFFKIWFGLALFTATYACFQQAFGMFQFEMDYLLSNPHEYKLYFQGGSIRKFSILSDPTTFGILCGACSVFMGIVAINEKKRWKRYSFFFVFAVLLLGMAFSGTRTSNIMLPAALCLYALLTITNKTTLTTIFIFIMAASFVLFGPIQNNTINRIRSTFDAKEESANVRDINRKFIQPYIYSHPIGGGISTSGLLGEKYNPGHPLAGFPPDSGLLLAAMELGWVGYALTILVYFLILYQCVHYYFLTKNKRYKVYVAAIACTIFSIIVTQYSQVTIGQLPTALFFYTALALATRLKELGKTVTLSAEEN